MVTIEDVAKHIQAKIVGNTTQTLRGIAALDKAKTGELSFLEKSAYKKYLVDAKASAIILREADAADCPCTALIVSDPYVAYAKAAQLFLPARKAFTGAHPTVVMGANCEIAENVTIDPYTVLGDGVKIASGVRIGPQCSIGDNVEIGADTQIHARVTIYSDCVVGALCEISSGAVIGADGFGLARDASGWIKIPQVGRVVIHDEVRIGANTTIDRGAMDDTILHKGVQLDNQIQIAHNVHVGPYTAMAACVGVAGSTRIGGNCLIGGAVGINGHINIADNVMITAMSGVINSINTPGVYASTSPLQENKTWRKTAVRIRQLEQLNQKVKQLAQTVKALQETQQPDEGK